MPYSPAVQRTLNAMLGVRDPNLPEEDTATVQPPMSSSDWDAAQQPTAGSGTSWAPQQYPDNIPNSIPGYRYPDPGISISRDIPYDPRDADSGPRESGPAPWTPISPNTPEPTYEIADGRTAPPTPGGNWEPWQTTPRPQPVAQEPPNPYGAPRSIAADLNPGAPADYGDGGQARRAAQQPEISAARPVQSTYGEPDYVDRRSDAERLLTTPVAMPARRELPPYDPERAARDPGYHASRSRTQDDVAAIPYQALEAIRQSVLDVVNNVEDTGTAWGEQRKVAALGNALLGVANTLGLPYNVVARTVNQMFPEMTIAGVGVGDVLSLYHDAFRLGAGATGVVQSAWQGKPVAAFERGVEMLGRGQEIADNVIAAAAPVVREAAQGARGLVDDAAQGAGRIWREGRETAARLNAEPGGGVTAAGLGAVPEDEVVRIRERLRGNRMRLAVPPYGSTREFMANLRRSITDDMEWLASRGLTETEQAPRAIIPTDAPPRVMPGQPSSTSAASVNGGFPLGQDEELLRGYSRRASGKVHEDGVPLLEDSLNGGVFATNNENHAHSYADWRGEEAGVLPFVVKRGSVVADIRDEEAARSLLEAMRDSPNAFRNIARRDLDNPEWVADASTRLQVQENELDLFDDWYIGEVARGLGWDAVTDGKTWFILNPEAMAAATGKHADRYRGTGTAYASAGPSPAMRGGGALNATNRALSEGLAGGVGGAVIEQARNPDEDPRTAAARGFAAGAVGFPLATRGIRAGARRLGAAGAERVTAASRVPQGEVSLGSGLVAEAPRIPPIPRQDVNITSAGDAIEEIRRTGMTPPSRIVEMIGARPEYLTPVAENILSQRAKVVNGQMGVRDVAKAYYMTVASQGADAIKVGTVEAKVPGFRIPEQFWAAERAVDGSPIVRPEEAAAAWLFTPRGQQALDALERGVYDAEAWAEGAAVRRAFGDDRFRTTNVFGERAPVDGRTKFNMQSIQAFTDQFNAVARQAAANGDFRTLDRFVKRLNGIQEAKSPFLQHALGFGETPTIDAVEINTWLTGHGDISRLQTKEAQLVRQINAWLKDPRVGTALRERITQQFDEVRRLLPPEQTADLPPEVFNHILHHWIWDRMKGIATTHQGFYDAMRNAANADIRPSTGFRADLANAAQGAFVGAASEQFSDEELTPQERLARIGAGAALGVGAGRYARGRGAGARLGSGMVPERAPEPRLTVEVLRERMDKVRALRDEARAAGDVALERDANDVLGQLTTDLSDAMNARRALEPRITSDVGRRLEDLPITENRGEQVASAAGAREAVRAPASELSAPVRVQPSTANRANAIMPFDPASAAAGAGAGAELDEDGNPVGVDPLRAGAGMAVAGILGRKGAAAAARGQGILPTNSLNTPREIVDNVIRQEQRQAKILAQRAAQKPLTEAQPGQIGLMPATPNGVMARIAEKVREAVEPWERRLDIVRYAGVLSDTAAHFINAAGGAMMQGVDVATGPIAAGIDVVRSAVTGKPREVFFSESPARLAGMRAGWTIGLENAREVLRTGLSQADAAKQLDRDSAGFASGSKKVDFAFELPLRALAAADAVFRTTAQGGHLAAEGMAAAMKANPGVKITPEQLRAAMKDPDLIERSGKLAARTVLQEDRAVTRWWRQDVLGKAPPGVRTALSLEFLFTKTPYNIVAQGVGLTPAGLLGVVQDMAQHKTAREMEFRVARAALGTAVMGAALADYSAGNLIGPRPTDEKEASTWPPGQIPWSRKVQVGGQTYYVPLAVLGPLAIPPVAAILLNESAKKGGDIQAKAGRVALGLGQYAAQNTFLEGVTTMGKLFDPRGNVSGNLERHAEAIAAQFSPHIIGGGSLGREIQQILGMPARDPDGMIEALLATHPLTAGRVEPSQDVLGRPRVPNASGPIRAVARVGKQNDAGVIRAFRNAKEGLPMAAPKQIKNPNTDQMHTLTPKQQHRWRRVFGQALQEGWNGEGNPTDVDSLRKVESDARTAANESILGLR